MTQKSTVNGYIRAVADYTHPLQTKLSLILTDFNPNGNRQGVPLSEKDNILRTAQYMPLKINFGGDSYSGHKGALPIGPIVSVYEGTDDGRAVILGEAIIWNEVYQDIADHLKVAFSEGINTSWEIYYEDSEKDANNIEWLSGCVFAGTCIVEVPAYGPNRTRVLAIAEALENSADKLNTLENNMSQANQQAQAATDMENTRNELVGVQDLLFKLWEGVDTLFNRTFQIEQAQVENDIGKIAAQFAEKLGKIADRIGELTASTAEKDTIFAELTSVKAELDNLKTAQAEAAEQTAKAELTKTRLAKLADAGLEVSETDTARVERYVSMPDEVFTAIITDLTAVRGKSATAEISNPVIPEPIGKSEFTAEELVEALKKEITRK